MNRSDGFNDAVSDAMNTDGKTEGFGFRKKKKKKTKTNLYVNKTNIFFRYFSSLVFTGYQI